MKIAFIVGGFPKLSETFILNQITGLIDRGCEVDIYADRSTNESKLHADVKKYNLLSRTRYVNRPDNQLLSICKLSRLLLTNLHKDPAILLRSLRSSNYDTQHAFSRLMLPYMALAFLDKKKYDVVHCHFGPNGLKGAFLKKLGLLQGKIITTFHGQDITHYPATWGEHFYDQLFSTGDLFLPISDCWRKKLVELGCDKERIIVHRMGVDCKKFRFASRHLNSDEKVRFLTVARLVEKKGIEYAVRAVARLTKIKPNVEYVVVGDGPLKRIFNN